MKLLWANKVIVGRTAIFFLLFITWVITSSQLNVAQNFVSQLQKIESVGHSLFIRQSLHVTPCLERRVHFTNIKRNASHIFCFEHLSVLFNPVIFIFSLGAPSSFVQGLLLTLLEWVAPVGFSGDHAVTGIKLGPPNCKVVLCQLYSP